ncbi:MAG: hypothetical protein H6668_16555 [Ardenticatenaceae bacterium]|nr:hypothetical protein [Ardenticatenaceae bacterium]
MGFPTWTLWGMGITAFLALLWIGLAYLALSPRWLLRLGLSGYRLDLRLRLFIGYGFACLLLALGFFLAGVPLGEQTAVSLPATSPAETPIMAENEQATFTPFPTITSVPATATTASVAAAPATNDGETEPTEPSTGAFVPNPTVTPTAVMTPTATIIVPTAVLSTTAEATATPSPTPTTTATSTPTNTPTPTITPTPIVGETAVINTGSSTVWMRRTPGGQNLVLVKGGDVVILQPGYANRASTFWQEIRTVDGVVGWLEISYLDKAEN